MVDILNIELFEKAAEQQLALVPCCQAITDLAIRDCEKINLYILQYLRVYKQIPYPLNSIEDDIKYVVIGTYMLDKSGQSDVKMWVDHGLIILLNEEDRKVIKFQGIYWAIQTVNEIKPDNLDIENWKDEIGYAEFEWVLRQLISGKQTAGFYDKFMPAFVTACRNQPMVLKWELGNILKFGYVPKEQEFIENKIIDKNKNEIYMLDTYVAGVRQDATKKVWQVNIGDGLLDDQDDEEQNPKIKVYGFQVYKKPIKFTGDMKPGDDRLKRFDVPCMAQIFQRLTAIKNTTEQQMFENFTGAVCGDKLVYTINGRLYIGDKNLSFGDKEIARGVQLYSVDKKQVYFYKNTNIGEDIVKRKLYSYTYKDSSFRVVNIDFVKE